MARRKVRTRYNSNPIDAGRLKTLADTLLARQLYGPHPQGLACTTEEREHAGADWQMARDVVTTLRPGHLRSDGTRWLMEVGSLTTTNPPLIVQRLILWEIERLLRLAQGGQP